MTIRTTLRTVGRSIEHEDRLVRKEDHVGCQRKSSASFRYFLRRRRHKKSKKRTQRPPLRQRLLINPLRFLIHRLDRNARVGSGRVDDDPLCLVPIVALRVHPAAEEEGWDVLILGCEGEEGVATARGVGALRRQRMSVSSSEDDSPTSMTLENETHLRVSNVWEALRVGECRQSCSSR